MGLLVQLKRRKAGEYASYSPRGPCGKALSAA